MKKVLLFCVCAVAATVATGSARICDKNPILTNTSVTECVSSWSADTFRAALSAEEDEQRCVCDIATGAEQNADRVPGREKSEELLLRGGGREDSDRGSRTAGEPQREGEKRGLTHVASFSTTFDRSVYARSYNIALACSNFCYYRVKAGETLSFNGVVGARTAERGYKEAKVIENGVYVPGIGGGVCQVSTTLYNAWITAGLKVGYVRAHTLPSSYCALSRDATVSDWTDLLLVNDSGSDVVVNATVTGGKVTFDVYGMPCPYSYRYETRVLEKTPPPDPVIEYVSYIEDDLESKQISPAKNGWVSELVRHTYIGDDEIAREVVRRDVYSGVAARIQVRENID